MSLPTPSATPDAPPDWAASAADLTCPLCGYNLRGLTDPRCPECGFAFRWAELLDARRDRHPWLFEHAGRRVGRWRNARTFLSTWARAAFPRRFWRTVSPTNPVHVRRLLIYWALAYGLLAATVLTTAAAEFAEIARTNAIERAQWVPDPAAPGRFRNPMYPLGSDVPAAYVRDSYPPIWSRSFATFAWTQLTLKPPPLAIIVLAWPWLTLATLLVFRSSMRQARVDWRHVARACVYACDFGLLAIAAEVILFGTSRVLGSAPGAFWPSAPEWVSWPGLVGGNYRSFDPGGPLGRWFAIADLAVAVTLAVVPTYRLTIAYGRYLRFTRPFVTVLAAQLMVALVVAIILIRFGWDF